MSEIRTEPPVEDGGAIEADLSNEPTLEEGAIDVSRMEVDKDDLDFLVEQLEHYVAKENREHKMVAFSKVFWDNWLAKLFASFVSIKIWILFWVLYIPYELVQRKLISGDNYTSIIIIVAPLVVGLREYTKLVANKSSESSGTDIVSKIRKYFKI